MKDFRHFLNLSVYAGAALIGAVTAFVTIPSTSTDASPVNRINFSVAQDQADEATFVTSLKSQNNDAMIEVTEAEGHLCLGACLEISNRLMNLDTMDDVSFENLFGQMHELAEFLETNYLARMDMLDLAMTTPEGKRRALIVNAFSLLPKKQKEQLGNALLESENWRVRADGATLSISSESLSPQKAEALFTAIWNETHPLVKTSLLGGIKNATQLKGDQGTLNYLSDIFRTDTDSSVRSAAMLAKLALQKDPHDALPDTFMALTSGDIELQRSAFIALDEIYEANTLIDGRLDSIDHESVRRALENFMNVEINTDNRKAMERLLMESDRFYDRHFGGAK